MFNTGINNSYYNNKEQEMGPDTKTWKEHWLSGMGIIMLGLGCKEAVDILQSLGWWW